MRLVSDADPHGMAEAFIAAVHSIALFRAFSGENHEASGMPHVAGIVGAIWKGLRPSSSGER